MVLRKSTNKLFIRDHLTILFSAVNHNSQTEREGCARAFGFAASSHLDAVIEKLGDIAKTDMVIKKSGFMGMVKDKSESDVARIKATMMLCYGFVTLYAPPSLIQSRVEVNILASINPHFANVREVAVKENLIRCVDLIGKSLHPSHLKNDKFVLHRRSDLLNHMQAYMKSEDKSKITTDIRALSMDSITTLLTLQPKLADTALYELIDIATQSVFDISPPPSMEKRGADNSSRDATPDKSTKGKAPGKGDGDQGAEERINKAFRSLDALLATVIVKDTSASCLESVMKHLGRWMAVGKGTQRHWMLASYRNLLKAYYTSFVQQTAIGEDRGSMDGFGQFVAELIPRCTDPILEVRKNALGCVQLMLRIQMCYRGGGSGADPLIDAISKLETRAEKTEASQQFAVVNDLSKVLSKKIGADDLLGLMYPLFDGLLDNEASSSSGACVVINGIFRLRGEELGSEVTGIIDALSDKMVDIEHERTSTGVHRAVRTLAMSHLAKVLAKLQAFDLPYSTFVVDTWQTLATDEQMAPLIVDSLLKSLRTCRPYDEDKNTKIPSLAAMKATSALRELLIPVDIHELVQENFSKILAAILVRIGSTADVEKRAIGESSKEILTPSEDAISVLRAFVDATKADFLTTALDFIDEELEIDGWTMLGSGEHYTSGLTVVAEAICKNVPQHVPTLVEEFEPVLKQVCKGFAHLLSDLLLQHGL